MLHREPVDSHLNPTGLIEQGLCRVRVRLAPVVGWHFNSSSLDLMTELTNRMSTPYNRAHHGFAVVVACFVFLLIVAGALVTSNEAGLSVPDWPTSFGSLYRIPPLVGGVKFEHGHRMLAEWIGLLTIGLAVWTQRVDQRRWMRVLGWSALGTVIAQGILGGLTVLFYLPPAISTAHATLAQTFFCIMVSIAFFTSRSWVQMPTPVVRMDARPRLTTIAMLTVAAVWLRHSFAAAHHWSSGGFLHGELAGHHHPEATSRNTATGPACDVSSCFAHGSGHAGIGQLHHPSAMEPGGFHSAYEHGCGYRCSRCMWSARTGDVSDSYGSDSSLC
jgi:heme A synthase